MKLAKILVPLSLALFVAGCGKGSNTNNTNSGGNTSKASNTANTAPSPKATLAPETDVRPAASAKAAKPEDAAEGLFNAWKTKDRAAASNYATNIAIDTLFKEGGPEGLQFQGCDKQGDDYMCGYSYEGGGLIMTVSGSATDGYKVTGTGFIAD